MLCYTWGSGARGVLGHGSEEDVELGVNAKLVVDGGVGCVVTSGCHTLLLCSSQAAGGGQGTNHRGVLWACGENEHGQCGYGLSDHKSTPFCSVPKNVALQERLSVARVAVGWRHSALVSADGRLFTWGRGQDGELGHGSGCENVHAPMQVLLQQHAVGVACGWKHTAVWGASAGSLYTCGSNGKGQLGLGKTRAQMRNCHSFTLVSLPHVTVDDVRCGMCFTLVLTSSSSGGVSAEAEQTDDYKQHQQLLRAAMPTRKQRVFAFGDNRFGQLGVGDCEMRVSPCRLDALQRVLPAGITVQAIRCGWTHAMLLMSDGGVLLWGRGDMGQQGNNSRAASVTTPTMCAALKGQRITSIACGTEHCLAVAAGTPPTVWAWGWGEHGNLGLTHSKGHPHALVPQRVQVPEANSLDYLRVEAGGACSVLLCRVSPRAAVSGPVLAAESADQPAIDAITPKPAADRPTSTQKSPPPS